MAQKYEYKFVRLGEGYMSVRKDGREGYQDAILEHAADGWRLVQVFAPVTGGGGFAKYFELILERPVSGT